MAPQFNNRGFKADMFIFSDFLQFPKHRYSIRTAGFPVCVVRVNDKSHNVHIDDVNVDDVHTDASAIENEFQADRRMYTKPRNLHCTLSARQQQLR